jgi:hypothetical protein
VQHDSLAFWSNPESVAYWDDLLCLHGALVRHAALLQTATHPETVSIPYQLLLFT